MNSTRNRDRDETKKVLLNALGAVLARDGFTGLGVNAVAREAGVDKVLIYRYFGGLQGMVQEFAMSRDFWPGVEDIAGPDMDAFLALPLPQMVAQAVINYARFMRERPLTQAIMAWTLTESNELTRAFTQTRQGTFDAMANHALHASDHDVDPAQLGNLLGVAMSFLAVGRRFPENFHNPLLSDPDGWDSVEDLVRVICERVLGTS